MALKKEFYQKITDQIIEQLEQGTAPWQKPWSAVGLSGRPKNIISGRNYRGINTLILSMANERNGWNDPRWLTWNQAQKIGANIRKGEKSIPIQFWKFSETEAMKDENGKPVLDENGKQKLVRYHLERPLCMMFNVFNAQQCDGIPPLEITKIKQEWEILEEAEGILKESGAVIEHHLQDSAFYRVKDDKICLPERKQFPNEQTYYSTALHELGHWTGHESRLNRNLLLPNPFGSMEYAKEELRAEISSMFLSGELGILHETESHSSYVKSWLKALKDDPKEIFAAAADAEKIADYILSFSLAKQEELVDDKKENRLIDEAIARVEAEKKERVYLDVIYAERNEIKHLGAKWDKQAKSWYVPGGVDPEPFQKWLRSSEGESLPAGKKEVAPAVIPEGNSVVPSAAEKIESPAAERVYIECFYKERGEVKALGAKWDRQVKSWYVPEGMDLEPFQKWITSAGAEEIKTMEETTSEGDIKVTAAAEEKIYLVVPFKEKDEAKASGAKWDKQAKSWYAPAGVDLEPLNKWIHPKQIEQSPAMNPREEFAENLRAMGMVVTGPDPIMDGKGHRIMVEGGKKGQKDGFYVGYLDGHPAGYMKNNKTGQETKWKAKGYSMSDEEKAQLAAVAAQKKQDRAVALSAKQEEIAVKVSEQVATFPEAKAPTLYMTKKGIQVFSGVKTDVSGMETHIPAYDASGKLWTCQHIQNDGTKRFNKFGKKEGCFHPVGGFESLSRAKTIIIAEGYATAASISAVAGEGVVSAFDSGNIPSVAKALHAKFPDKDILIAGDDDRHLELTLGHNPGREKAVAAAAAVGGRVVFPVFGKEDSWPKGLPKFSPAQYKAHKSAEDLLQDQEGNLTVEKRAELNKQLLQPEQIKALRQLKKNSDFNDLAQNRGKEIAERQITWALRPIGQKLLTEIQKEKRQAKTTVEKLVQHKQRTKQKSFSR